MILLGRWFEWYEFAGGMSMMWTTLWWSLEELLQLLLAWKSISASSQISSTSGAQSDDTWWDEMTWSAWWSEFRSIEGWGDEAGEMDMAEKQPSSSSRSRSADEAVEAAEEQVRLPRRKAGRAPGLRYCLLLPQPPPLLGATIAAWGWWGGGEVLLPFGGFSSDVSGDVDIDLTPESRLLRPPVVVVSADASPTSTLRGEERVRWRGAALCWQFSELSESDDSSSDPSGLSQGWLASWARLIRWLTLTVRHFSMQSLHWKKINTWNFRLPGLASTRVFILQRILYTKFDDQKSRFLLEIWDCFVLTFVFLLAHFEYGDSYFWHLLFLY